MAKTKKDYLKPTDSELNLRKDLNSKGNKYYKNFKNVRNKLNKKTKNIISRDNRYFGPLILSIVLFIGLLVYMNMLIFTNSGKINLIGESICTKYNISYEFSDQHTKIGYYYGATQLDSTGGVSLKAFLTFSAAVIKPQAFFRYYTSGGKPDENVGSSITTVQGTTSIEILNNAGLYDLLLIIVLFLTIVFFFLGRTNKHKSYGFNSKYNVYLFLLIIIAGITYYCTNRITENNVKGGYGGFETTASGNGSSKEKGVENINKIVLLIPGIYLYLGYKNFRYLYPAGPNQKHDPFKYVYGFFEAIMFIPGFLWAMTRRGGGSIKPTKRGGGIKLGNKYNKRKKNSKKVKRRK